MDFAKPEAGLDFKRSSKDWITGQARDDAALGLCGSLFRGRVIVSKRLDPGSSHPTKPLRALAGTPTGRDDAACSLDGVVSGLCVMIWL